MVPGTVYDWVREIIGSGFEEIVTRPVATTSGIRLLGPSGDRWAWFLINYGSNPIVVQLDELIPGGSGIPLAPDGSFLSLEARDDLILQCRPLFAYSTTGTSDLYLVETRKVAG